jgi:hypothetical protein
MDTSQDRRHVEFVCEIGILIDEIKNTVEPPLCFDIFG